MFSGAKQFSNVAGVVLAAGKGTRMHSNRPKVLQEILGKPLLWYVRACMEKICPKNYFVIGFGREEIEKQFPELKEFFVLQKEQLGTGHAVKQALPRLNDDLYKYLLITNGDAPLIPESLLTEFVEYGLDSGCPLCILSMEPDDPAAYGRIVRDENDKVHRVVEASDIDDNRVKVLNEVNSGIYLLRTDVAGSLLDALDADNNQKEYYLTQIVELASKKGLSVAAYNCGHQEDLLGINTVGELVLQEENLQKKIIRKFLDKGVIIRSPALVRIGPEVQIEPGADITGPAEIMGATSISGNSRIEANVVILDSNIHAAHIKSFSHIQEADIQNSSVVGPYARVRPGTCVCEHARLGNFVEVKKAVIGKNSKVNHLSYIGDAEIGEDVNIGAGTITCNYDGNKKYMTQIGDKAFIGSNTALVAPVEIGRGALVGAGSIITKNVPEDCLGIARNRQKNIGRKK
ncbi:MAG: bifunctional UDP-N-acetylglucosamine diphosphorylase/glucosamine-1-phosphate N-acetyltransferase GlmU [Thermodesulfobacteriota bacterium]